MGILIDITLEENEHNLNHIYLEPLSGKCADFHREVRKLQRPYTPISESAYKHLYSLSHDYYKTSSGQVVTFGGADGGYALMPLLEVEANKILKKNEH